MPTATQSRRQAAVLAGLKQLGNANGQKTPNPETIPKPASRPPVGPQPTDKIRVADLSAWANTVINQASRSIIDSDDLVRAMVISLLTRWPMMISGATGTGKTWPVQRLAELVLTNPETEFGLLDCTAETTRNAFTGYYEQPTIDKVNGRLIPGEYKPGVFGVTETGDPLKDHSPRLIVLLDEFIRCRPSVQTATLQIMDDCLDHGVIRLDGENVARIHPGAVIFATGNNERTDHGSYAMAPPNANRFGIHYMTNQSSRESDLKVLQDQPHRGQAKPQPRVNGQARKSRKSARLSAFQQFFSQMMDAGFCSRSYNNRVVDIVHHFKGNDDWDEETWPSRRTTKAIAATGAALALINDTTPKASHAFWAAEAVLSGFLRVNLRKKGNVGLVGRQKLNMIREDLRSIGDQRPA